MSNNLNEWELKLPFVEFSHHRTPTYATFHSPIEACYGVNTLFPIDLLPLCSDTQERAKEMKKLYEQSHAQIEKIKASYKARANMHQNPMGFNPKIWFGCT